MTCLLGSDCINVSLTTWAVRLELSSIVLQKLNLVNGVLFTGGWAKKGLYVDVVDGIFKHVLKKNDAGEHFPLFAICLGFELISMIISKDKGILERFSGSHHASSLQFMKSIKIEGTIFQRFSADLLAKLSTDRLVMHHHKVYVSTVQARRYPVTAVQWHPEFKPSPCFMMQKNAFEWGLSMIPHSDDAIQVTQHFANFFVSSELAVRRPGKAPERAVPSPSPGRHAATRSRRVSSSSSPPTADGFGTGTPVPSPQSQSFSRGYGSILPTSLAYIVPSTRGCSPWRPDAVMSTTGRGRHSVLRIFKGRLARMLTLEPFSEDQGRSAVHPARGIPPISFLAPCGFTHPLTRTHVRLLGPCFKTAEWVPAGRCQERAGAEARRDGARANHDRDATASPRAYQQPGLWPPHQSAPVHAPSRSTDRLTPFHIRPGRIAAPIRFLRQFKHSLTLFSKSFSSFPRGTCLLSVSRQYLALDGITALLGLHSQTTRLADSASWCDRVRARRGSHPLRRPFQGTWARSVAEDASPDYNSDSEAARFSSWAVPGSLAVTKGILGSTMILPQCTYGNLVTTSLSSK
ncbi:gamma-glutamyl hydrolase 2 [Artemisia annua]|uniref:Gamma-glutamyl hydrolase 2 n=1 Tax=Artemisia annua TaxID=35608 RepID=A0A2U1PYV3_ARTAN|nr:gamma-glutamyl hydrolase 2 [Artemisia annua]